MTPAGLAPFGDLVTTKPAIHKSSIPPRWAPFLLLYLADFRTLQAKAPHQALLIVEKRIDLRL